MSTQPFFKLSTSKITILEFWLERFLILIKTIILKLVASTITIYVYIFRLSLAYPIYARINFRKNTHILYIHNKFDVLIGSDQYTNHNDKNSNKITESGIFIIISKVLCKNGNIWKIRKCTNVNFRWLLNIVLHVFFFFYGNGVDPPPPLVETSTTFNDFFEGVNV